MTQCSSLLLTHQFSVCQFSHWEIVWWTWSFLPHINSCHYHKRHAYICVCVCVYMYINLYSLYSKTISELFSFLTLIILNCNWYQFSSVQSLSHLRLFATPWITECQASLSITNTRSLLNPMPIELVMPYSHLILCRPLLFLPPIPPTIRVFSNESTLHMRWPKYWSFSFSICPSNEHPGLISFRMDWLDFLAVQGTLKSLLQHHSQKPQGLGNPKLTLSNPSLSLNPSCARETSLFLWYPFWLWQF